MDIIEYLRSVISKPPEIKIPHQFPLRQPLYETVPIRLDSERPLVIQQNIKNTGKNCM